MIVPTEKSGRSVNLPWALAWRLAAGQIVSWGIFYYGFTVIAGPLQAETGWTRTFLHVGLSLGLLAWGACAYPVGWWIQRRGARGLMTMSSAMGGGALTLMGLSHTPALYLTAWVLLGVAMAGALYEPAFAVVTAAFGPAYRKGITLVTLVGGLASTAFVPLGQAAVDRWGWRMALVVLGVGHVMVCGPLHWWGLPRRPVGAPVASVEQEHWRGWWQTFRADLADPRFFGLAVWFAAHSAAFTGLIFLLAQVLQARGVESGTIVSTIAIMGPMQVLGRLFLSTRGENYSSLGTGLFAMLVLLGAVLVLLLLPPTAWWLGLFSGALGLGNGMLTIVRGTAVAELFGRERYAEINGALAAPGVLARAAAPLVLAEIWSRVGDARAVPLVVTLVVLGGLSALVWLRRTIAAGQVQGAARAGG